MSEIQAVLLGLLQGLTEYLPISSSGHLAVAAHFFGVDGEGCLSFTVAVHVATVLSTLVVLRREIWNVLRDAFAPRKPLWNEGRCYVWSVLVSMVPVGIVGLCFKDRVEAVFGSGLLVVGVCLLLTAALLAFTHFAPTREKERVSPWDALVIGIAQAVAVLPGLSRSGSTIATGLLLGNRKDALAQFSFLMVIPPILGEALLDVLRMAREGGVESGSGIGPWALALGFAAAFASGCVACRWMISLVRRGQLIYFAGYCAVAGLLLVAYNIM